MEMRSSQRRVTLPTFTTSIRRKAGVYCLRLVGTQQCYVGNSCAIGKRIDEHIRSMQRGRHRSKRIQQHFDQFGFDGYAVDVLELLPECDNKPFAVELYAAEEKWTYIMRDRGYEALTPWAGRLYCANGRTRKAGREECRDLEFAKEQVWRWQARVKELEGGK